MYTTHILFNVCLFLILSVPILGQNCDDLGWSFGAESPDTLYLCQDDGVINLHDFTENDLGTFSGIGVNNDNIFEPELAGGGFHSITYTSSNNESCEKVIVVVEFEFKEGYGEPPTNNVLNICSNEGSLLLTNYLDLAPTGGVLYVDDVLWLSDPWGVIYLEESGYHTIDYVYGQATCRVYIYVSEIVFDLPPSEFITCLNSEPFDLSVNGVFAPPVYVPYSYFSGPGIVQGTSVFDPALAGVGTHEIFYSNGTDSCSQSIFVTDYYPASITTSLDSMANDTLTLCYNEAQFTIYGNGEFDQAAAFYVNGSNTIIGDTLFFSATDFGYNADETTENTLFQITYLYIDINGSACPGYDTLWVNVLPDSCGVGTDIATLEASFLHLSPNPVQDVLQLSLEHNETVRNLAVDLYRLNGQLVERIYDKTIGKHLNFQYNTSHLEAGVYLIKMSSGGGQISKRFVKF